MPCKRSCAGGALPHTDTLIRAAAYGRAKSDCLKTTRQCAKRSLLALASCFSLRSLSRTTRKPVRWTLALTPTEPTIYAEAVTSQNQHQIDSVIPTRLPGDVTQQRREPAEVPRATRGNPRGNQTKTTACLTNRKQVSQTKFLS